MTTLEELSSLSRELVRAEQEVAEAESTLKALKEKARLLREETVPCAMQELGVNELKLDSGDAISIKSEVFAKIPDDRREEAYAWLEHQGLGGVIKTQVELMLGKGEIELARNLRDEFAGRGIDTHVNSTIHPQTLKAVLKEQLAKGVNVPLDLFGARAVFVAKVVKQ